MIILSIIHKGFYEYKKLRDDKIKLNKIKNIKFLSFDKKLDLKIDIKFFENALG